MLTRLLAGAVSVLMATGGLVAAPAGADGNDSWTSIYAGGPYDGSGWSTCPEPIRISSDTRGLKASQKQKARAALIDAIRLWNRPRFVTFAYDGEIPVTFDPATGVSTPTDGVSRDRQIYLTVVTVNPKKDREPGVVGLSEPLRLDPATRIIVEGAAAFRASYLNQRSRKEVAELFAHELGHVFGLGHSTSKRDVMYPYLRGALRMGPGDIAGGRAVLKPCPATPAPTATG